MIQVLEAEKVKNEFQDKHRGSSFIRQLHLWDCRARGRDWGPNPLGVWQMGPAELDLQGGATA